MKKSILIIGLGRFGLNLIEFFSHLDVDIIGIDVDEDAVNKAVKKTPYVYTCDSTNEEALKEIGIDNVDIAIIALGQDNPNGVVTGIGDKGELCLLVDGEERKYLGGELSLRLNHAT